jgi:uncharacterized protein involved in exopolysaccharide biosynthesis
MGLMLRDREDVPTSTSLDLGEFVGVIRSRMLLVLVTMIVGAGAAFLYTSAREPLYSATAVVLVRPLLTSPVKPNDPVNTATEIRIATSAAVGDIARRALGSELGTRRLLKGLSVDSQESTDILEFSFSDRAAAVAQGGAQAFAEAYLTFKSQQAEQAIAVLTGPLEERIAVIDGEIKRLERSLATLPAGSPRWEERLAQRAAKYAQRLALQGELVPLLALNTDPGEVIEPAFLPTGRVGPARRWVVGLGLVLGLLVGIGLAYLWSEAERMASRRARLSRERLG